MKLGMGKWDLGVGFCLLSLEAVLHIFYSTMTHPLLSCFTVF